MVEAALLLVVIFSITLAVVDFARILMFEAILNKAAEEGLNVATTISNYDMDVRELNVDDSRYYDFYEARRRVLEAATRLPLGTFFTDPSTPSSAQLYMFDSQDNQLGENTPTGTPPASSIPVISRAAAVIRPAEYVLRENRDALNNVVSTDLVANQLRAPAAGNTLPPQKMNDMLRASPIQVELHAKITAFCPHLLCPWMSPSTIVRGVAIGYRENGIPRGPLPPPAGEAIPGYATASTVTSTTQALGGGVTTTTEGPPVGWSTALSWTRTNKFGANLVWCPGTPNPVPCPSSKQ